MSSPVAIVTGASRGIGKATAIRLARNGYRVALWGRDREALLDTARACKASWRDVHSAAVDGDDDAEQPSPKRLRPECSSDERFLPCVVDISLRSEVCTAVQNVVTAFGDISVLICNAGVLLSSPVLNGDPSKWEQELDVNVKGTMAVTHVALPHILKSSNTVKAVIIIGSTGSRWSWPYGAGYCASKHALKGFAGSLFEEVRDNGIKVCIVMPGFTDTDMIATNPGMIREKTIQPDDVAHAIEGVLGFPLSACPTEILIRPQYKCTDGSVNYTIV